MREFTTHELVINDFKLPSNVKNHPSGYILKPENETGHRICFWTCLLVECVYLWLFIGTLVHYSLYWILCLAASIFNGFCLYTISKYTTYTFCLQPPTDKYIIKQTVSFCGSSTQSIRFTEINGLVQSWGCCNKLWLTTEHETIILSEWTNYHAKPEWGQWLSKMGFNLTVTYQH